MSIRGKAMHLMMRYRHLLKGKWKPDTVDFQTSVAKLREDCDAAAARMIRIAQGVTIEPAAYTALNAEWVIPEGAPRQKAVLYFHGGGFIMGNAKSHRAIVSNFAKRLGLRALVFDYSLAPEHPAPAAVNDAAAIYEWMMEQGFEPSNIVFAGDSAGGGIAIGTLLKLKDDKRPLPAACAAFSPNLDMTLSGDSYKTRRKADPCTPEGMNEVCAAYYTGNGDRRHPYASPVFGDLAGLPPILIQVGNNERLRDDSVLFVKRARQAGSPINLHVWKGMFHCFPLLAPAFPEATAALEETLAFLREPSAHRSA